MDDSESNEILAKVAPSSDVKVKGKVKFKGKLHRGEKWSERNNVKPCTTSFGVCDLKWQVEVTVSGKSSTDTGEEENLVTFEELEDPNKLRMSFNEPRKDYRYDVFISEDDDNVLFPEDLANFLGYSFLEIQAANYEFQETEQYPFGYVDLNIYAESL